MEAKTYSGDNDITSGDTIVPYPDYNIDSNFDYSKIVFYVMFILHTTGSTVSVFLFILLYKAQSRISMMSLCYRGLFWIFVPFTIGCSTTQCYQYLETLYIANLLSLTFLPVFWLIMLGEGWISK